MPHLKEQQLTTSSLVLVSGNMNPGYHTHQFFKSDWKWEFLWKLKEINNGERFLSKQKGMESKYRD